MTSRERVVAALNHRQPDRVPIDIGSAYNTGIHVTALDNLRQYYGLPKKDIEVYEVMQMLGTVDDEVRQLLGGDVIGLNNLNDALGVPFRGEKQAFPIHGVNALVSAKHVIDIGDDGKTCLYPEGDSGVPPSAMMPKDGYFFDVINRSPGFDKNNLTPEEDFKDFFGLISDEEARLYEENAKQLYEGTDCGILGLFGYGGIGDPSAVPAAQEKHPKGIRTFEDWCAALVLYPDYVNTVYEMWTDNCIKNLEIYKQAVGDRIHAVVISGTDFGTQNGLMISPKIFRKLYKPYYQRMNDWVHQNTNWKTFYHCCGGIMNLLDDFVEMGVDILNPVQIAAKGMDARVIKEKYGDKLVFWGAGVDTQDMLPYGTPAEVKAQVTERLDVFAPGGGFIFNTIHNIMGNVKPENIDAVFQTAKNYKYK